MRIIVSLLVGTMLVAGCASAAPPNAGAGQSPTPNAAVAGASAFPAARPASTGSAGPSEPTAAQTPAAVPTTSTAPTPAPTAPGPTPAAVVHQPDGSVRLGPSGYGNVQTTGPLGKWFGVNVYNATGAGQQATWSILGSGMVAGTYLTFDISIRNAGTAADRFTVRATGPATPSWIVTYARNATNITAAVIAGTYRTPSLAPGATYLINAKITINQGGPITRLVTIKSVADPAKVDAVSLAYRGI
jgi:hypothetical protein